MAKIRHGKNIIVDIMDKIHLKDGFVECCGGKTQKLIHVSCEKRGLSQFKCECGNIITTNTYIDKEYSKGWDWLK